MSALAVRHIVPRRVTMFAIVGAAATASYIVLALVLTSFYPTAAVLDSVIAYTVASIVSYCGHRWITFGSARPHVEAVPRFAAVTAIGYAITAAMPLVVVNWLGLDGRLSVAGACILVPAVTYVGLDRLVYRAKAYPPGTA
jgi:putative flippase GtrA